MTNWEIKLFGLQTGDTIEGIIQPPKEGEKYFTLLKVTMINGRESNSIRDKVSFEWIILFFEGYCFV